MNDLAKIEDLETRFESERHLRKSLETRLLKVEAELDFMIGYALNVTEQY